MGMSWEHSDSGHFTDLMGIETIVKGDINKQDHGNIVEFGG
jgi:hypothetical protein